MKRLSQINESVFDDIISRSRGKEERKEDVCPGNVNEIKFIDCGRSVLWGDRNLVIDDEDMFTYDEAISLKLPKGVRLPTLEECKEFLDNSEKECLWDDESFRINGIIFPCNGFYDGAKQRKVNIGDSGRCFCISRDNRHIHGMFFSQLGTTRVELVDWTLCDPDDKVSVRLVKEKL